MRVVAVAALAAVLLAPALAQAQKDKSDAAATAEAKAHFQKGTRFYKQARYKDAITEFEAAYKARAHGVLFFNIAQSYEKLGDIPSALRNYHEHLRAIPNADDKANVELAMKNLEMLLAEQGVQQLL